MSACFIAVVDANNVLVFFRSAYDIDSATETGDDAHAAVALNHEFIAKMALDFLPSPAEATKPMLLLTHDGVTVYGTVLNTRVKFLVATVATDEPEDLGNTMKALSDAYVRYQCNPLRRPGAEIHSEQFERNVDHLLGLRPCRESSPKATGDPPLSMPTGPRQWSKERHGEVAHETTHDGSTEEATGEEA